MAPAFKCSKYLHYALCVGGKPMINSALWKIVCTMLGYTGILRLYLIYNPQLTVFAE